MLSSGWAGACIFLIAGVCLAQSAAPVQPVVLNLSLQKAIEIATSASGNYSVQTALQGERMSYSSYTLARSNLLPFLDGSVAEQNQTVNPRALGLRFSAPGLTIPNSVGPFYTFDARVRLNQTLLNLSAIRHLQAGHDDMNAAKWQTDGVREIVAAKVARLYAAALRADSQFEASQSNLTDALALSDLAVHRAAVGEGTDLESARAALKVARIRQQILAAETARTRSQLELISVLNLGWDTTLHLTGSLDGLHPEATSVAEAMATALRSRADFKVVENRMASARLNQSAAGLERMPSLVGYADYGELEGTQTHTIGAALRIPLFSGGRIESDRVQAAAVMRDEEIRQKELKGQVELEVRQALAALTSTEQQVQVAGQAVTLAEQEMAGARRRYEAGVTNSVEVTEAETALESARDDRTAALFDYANARIDLAQATGTIASMAF
jgi:outer membrane protein